jgi:DNA/RNA-binding domain of Phe-tRNA-synthetase-like protein
LQQREIKRQVFNLVLDRHGSCCGAACVSEPWWACRAAYPGAASGVLVMRGVANPDHHDALDRRKEALETDLRARFAGGDRTTLAALPTVQACSAYYARFRKTYHVLLQLESVAFKNRPIPRVAALVEAMFMAELKNQMLTAGHDLAALQLPVVLDAAVGNERYTLLSGKEQALAPGDMFMRDGLGVISSIVYGPDRRTQIGAGTQVVMFTVYAPPGISVMEVEQHLADIQANVLLVAPDAGTELRQVYAA